MSKADITKKVECLLEAYREALSLIPSAIYQETGYQLDQVIKGFLPGLLQMLAVLGLSAVAGAGAGAAIGFFLGGVGAFPGAVAGSQFGLDIGTFILTWMGLKFLAEAIGQGLGEWVSTLENAVWRAWIAADNDRMFPGYEIDQAARGLARCVGILFRLILQGVVALILGKGGVSVGKGMASTGRSVLTKGIQGTADVNVADVVAQLRQSKLPKAFADWVEQNWEDLLRNPKLQTGKAEPVRSAAAASNAVSPSQLKAAGDQESGSAATKVSTETHDALVKGEGSYGELAGTLDKGFQRHHMNQNAAFNSVIPKDQGFAIGIRGNAFTELGTPHYEFHRSLENFWDSYRKGGDLFGEVPTNSQYGDAIEQALKEVGINGLETQRLSDLGNTNREFYGLMPEDIIPRIPRNIYQSGSK